MPARILLGTASWTDKPLIESGTFYPPEVKSPEDRLRYYATQFPLVESDSAYYGLPTVDTSQRWVERTPPGFLFDVKAYSLFTDHPTPVARLPKVMQANLPPILVGKRQFYRESAPKEFIDLCWSTYTDALLPLHEARKLGVVLFQFPKWVLPNKAAFAYLEEIRERLGNYRGAVEFRNALWLDAEHREQTFALLGDCDLSYVCVDEPQGFPSSVPPVTAATNRVACTRFHGRNVAMWEEHTQTASERFDYYYSRVEMAEWAPRIVSLATESDELHVIMNTNNFDQGPVNARVLETLLVDAGLEPAPPQTADSDAGPERSTNEQGRLL
jgi:uncharacterized protein YecE (DUF72 family)